jgi:hypothetical protein
VALQMLHEASVAFGIASDNSSKEARALERGSGRKSLGLLSQIVRGASSGRKAAQAANAKMKAMRDEDHEDYLTDGDGRSRKGARKGGGRGHGHHHRRSSGKMAAAKSPQGKKRSATRSRR